MVDKINALPHVTPVTSPYDSAGNLVNTSNINADQTVGFLQVNFDEAAEQHLAERGEEVRPHGDHHVG